MASRFVRPTVLTTKKKTLQDDLEKRKKQNAGIDEAQAYMDYIKTLTPTQQNATKNREAQGAMLTTKLRPSVPSLPGLNGQGGMNYALSKQALLTSEQMIRENRAVGLYDTEQVAYNPNTAHLASTDYLKRLQAALGTQMETSRAQDEQNKARLGQYDSDLEDWYLNLEGNKPTDWDLKALDTIKNGREYASSYELNDEERGRLTDEYLQLVARMKPDYEYQSQTPTLQARWDALDKEIQRRNTGYQELSSELRSSPTFLTDSVYTPMTGKSYTQYVKEHTGLGWFGQLADRIDKSNDTAVLYDYMMNPQYALEYDLTNDVSYRNKGYNLLTDDEKLEAAAAMAQGEETFTRWLSSFEATGTLTRRKAMLDKAVQENYALHPLTAVPMYGAARMADVVSGIMAPVQAGAAMLGYDDPNSMLYASNNFSQNVGSVQEQAAGELMPWQVPFTNQKFGSLLYNGVSSVLNFALARGIGGSGKAATAITQYIMSSQAASNTIYNALEEGQDPTEAVVRGMVSGAIEAFTEKYSIEALLKNPSMFAAFVGQNMATEASEEVLSSVLNTGADWFISKLYGHEDALTTEYAALKAQLGDPKEASRQVLQNFLLSLGTDAVLGGFTGGAMGAAVGAQTSAQRNAVGKEVSALGNVSKLVDIGLTMDVNGESNPLARTIKQAEADGKKVSNRQVGRLYETMYRELDEQSRAVMTDTMRDAVAQRMVELGDSPDVAQEAADAVLAVVRNEKPSLGQRQSMARAQSSTQVIKEIMFADDATSEGRMRHSKWVRTADEKANAAGAASLRKMGELRQTRVGKETTDQTIQRATVNAQQLVAKKATDKKSMDVELEDGQSAEILQVSNAEGEVKVTIKGADGKKQTVSASELRIKSRPVAAIVSYLDTTSERMSDEQANLLLHSYTGGDASEHIADFNDAYAAGFMARELPPSKRMDRRMAQQIAEQGRKDAEAAEQKRQATIGAIATGRRGAVTFTENMADAGSEKALKAVSGRLSDTQKKSVAAIKQLARATGVNFVFFESQADDTGRYTAENGHYDVKTGTIYLDLNSGKNSTTDLAEYAILRTAGHELTHFMEHSSKEGYAALRDFVTTELTRRGEDFDALVVKKMDNAARSGAPLTRAGAISEVVADASELMLRDTKAIERLAKKDQGLMAKIKGFIQSFVQKVRDAFIGVDAVHEEARVMMQELAEEFQQKWDFALEEAVKQEQQAEAETEIESVVQYSSREEDQIEEDKYFAREIDKWDGASTGKRIKIGQIKEGSVYTAVGLPAGQVTIDESKLAKILDKHGDHITREIVKKIPQMLSGPVVITEPLKAKNTVNVFTNLIGDNGKPIMISLMMRYNRSGVSLENAVRTMQMRNDTDLLITDETTLYIDGNKKRTTEWFQGLGKTKVPFAGTRSGFIRSIAYSDEKINRENAETQNSPQSQALSVASQIEFTDGETQNSLRSMTEDYDTYRQMMLTHGSSQEEVDALFRTIDAVMADVEENKAILDFGWDVGRDQRSFNPVKPNSDNLYQVSVDFSTLCRKRLLQQAVQERLESEYNTVLTKAERVAIRNELMRLREEGKQIEVACALCYVESARLKSPAQIQRFFDDRRAVMVDFFAKKNKAYMADIDRQADDLIEHFGYERGTAKKELKTWQKRSVEQLKQGLYKKYQPSAEEEAIIAVAMDLPGDAFKTDKGLWKLKQEHETIFDAYTSYVRNATKAKGIEGDEAWWAGDSKSISDKLIQKMNAENGLRSQSWSDFQVIHLLDYMAAVIELSTRGAKMQTYTKVPDFVNLMGDTGAMINLSLIPSGFNGKLEYDPIEGMPIETALELRDRFPNTAGTICIGITDKHIRMLLADPNTDYVIPYHSSSLDKKTRTQMGMKVWDDFQPYQTEKKRDYPTTVKDNGTYHKSPNFSEWYDYETVSARAAEVGAEQAMREAAQRYIDLCHRRGLQEKFAQFASEANYWKLLIDRKMINQKTGEIINQEAVKPRFDLERIRQILKAEVERFNAQNKDAKEAADHIAQMWEKGDIRKAAKSKKVQDAVKAFDATVIVRNIVESAKELEAETQRSLRDMPADLTREYVANLTASDALNDVEKDAIRIYSREVGLLRTSQEKLDQVIAERDAQPEDKQKMYAQRVRDLRQIVSKHYDKLEQLEKTKGVAPLIQRSREYVQEYVQGKTAQDVENLIASTEREVGRLNKLIQAGNKDLVKERDRRINDLRQLRNQATQKLLAEQTRYRQMIATDREVRKLTQQARQMQEKIATHVRKLDKLRRQETDYKNIPEAFKPAVDTLVSMFTDNFGTMVFDKQRADRLSAIYHKLLTVDGNDPMATLAPYYDPDVEADLEALAEWAEKDAQLRTTSGTRMEKAALRLAINKGILEAVDHITAIVTNAQNLFYAGKKAKFDAIGTQMGDALKARQDKKTLRGVAGQALTVMDNLLRTGNMTPVYFFEQLDNEVLSTLWDDIRQGQNAYAFAMRDGRETIQGLQQLYHYWDWADSKRKDNVLEITTEKGRKLTFTREQALWVYATWKREQSNEIAATKHLTEGGIVYEGKKQEGGKVVTTVQSTPAVLSEGDIARITGWLTDEQKAYADGMVKYLSEDMAELGNRASMEMFGIRKYTESYYFPYRTAGDQLYQSSASGRLDTTSDSRLKHASFTHALTKGASAPLVMGDFSAAVEDHIAHMATYASFVLPIESMNRVLNYKVTLEDDSRATVRSLIEQKYGESAKKYIATLLTDLNGGVRNDNRASGTDYLVRMYKKGAVAASLSTALQQPTSLFRAMAMISPKYIAASTFSKRDWDELTRYSGVAVIKDMGRFDTDVGRSNIDWLHKKHPRGFMERLDAASGFLPEQLDRLTWAHLWSAVKKEQADLHPEMDKQSEAFLALCGERFNDIVDHTQVYDSILSRSQLMRGKDAMSKMTTSFMAEPTLAINMLYNAAVGITKPGGKAKAAKVMAAVLSSNIAAAAMAALIQAWNDDDDKRSAQTKYLDKFLENALDNNNPLSMLPVVSDVWSMFQGYDVQRADMSLISEMYKAIQRFQSDNYSPYRKMEELLGTTSKFFGLPVKNLLRDGRRAYNLFTSSFESPNSYELTMALPWADDKATAHYEELFLAMHNGDTKREEEIRGYLTDVKDKQTDAQNEGVRDRLKERFLGGSMDEAVAKAWLKTHMGYDNRKAFETVDRWRETQENKGNEEWSYSIYNDFYNAVESGKNLDKEIKQLLDLGIEAKTLASNITTEFKPLLMELLATGKTSQAAALQAKILDAYVALGYDREKKLKDVKKWYSK